MLERLFPGKKRGFYVDVGAWDPSAYSITRHFYQRGWRGLNIEPIAWRHAMFVEHRPRDINLRCLVGNGGGPRRFFECIEEDYLSTTVAEVADAMRAKGLTVNEYNVDVQRLDTLLERHCPKIIDFLKIDVEGAEADVLKTIDLQRFRPRALIIEATIPGSGLKSWDKPDAFASWGEWEEDVLRQDYVFARFDGLNRFYVRREDKKLARRLELPPGIFDGIDPSHLPQAEADARLKVIEQQQIELAAFRVRIEAAENYMAQQEQHRVAVEAQIETLTAERGELERNLAVLRGRTEAAENFVAQREQQFMTTHAQIGTLTAQREEIDRHVKALESVAEQRLSDLAAAAVQIEALDRQAKDARQAIDVFEQWFDKLQAQPRKSV